MVKVQRKPSGNTNAGGAGTGTARPGTTGGLLQSSHFSQPIKLKKRINIFSDVSPDSAHAERLHHAPVHKESATWVIRKNDEMKYRTENCDKFEDPKMKKIDDAVKSEGFETARTRMRTQAADKFCKLAKSRYGGAEDLFRAVSGRGGGLLRCSPLSVCLSMWSMYVCMPICLLTLFSVFSVSVSVSTLWSAAQQGEVRKNILG
jgi:hypothetical protein